MVSIIYLLHTKIWESDYLLHAKFKLDSDCIYTDLALIENEEDNQKVLSITTEFPGHGLLNNESENQVLQCLLNTPSIRTIKAKHHVEIAHESNAKECAALPSF